MNITISTDVPQSAALLVADITFQNSEYDPMLWDTLLHPLMEELQQSLSVEDIREDPRIQATKEAYRYLGLDPSRYRPSSDSLLRRVIKGSGLYQINTLVDVNNYLSLKFRLPIGSYDVAQLTGPIDYGVGKMGDSYQGIGKKELKLAGFPLLRDQQGPFGSPISDSVRGMISSGTTRGMMVVYCFGQSSKELQELQQQLEDTLAFIFPEGKVIFQSIA